MTYKEVKHPKARLKINYRSDLNIQLWGDNNLYPQEMKQFIEASPTGGGCLERYATFIEGNGINATGFSATVCNRKGDTVDDLVHSIANDLAMHRGFAIHVNYNIFCQITSMTYIPFDCCRLCEENEDGTITFIAYHPDWTGRKTRAGKTLQVNKKSVRYYYQFNPIQQVVMSQIVADGGIENYRGQILWFSFDGRNIYPKPIYDKVITNLSTDEGLDNVKYRNVRNNFLPSGMLVRKRGASLSVDGEDNSESKREENHKSLEIFMGDENTGSMLEVEVEDKEEVPEWKNIEGTNFDKKFETTTMNTEERIYSAFGQEPFYCIRKGKTGFSGDVLSDAYDYYNSYVSRERRCISRAIEAICKHWSFNINPTGDYTIQPMVLIRQNTTSEV